MDTSKCTQRGKTTNTQQGAHTHTHTHAHPHLHPHTHSRTVHSSHNFWIESYSFELNIDHRGSVRTFKCILSRTKHLDNNTQSPLCVSSLCFPSSGLRTKWSVIRHFFPLSITISRRRRERRSLTGAKLSLDMPLSPSVTCLILIWINTVLISTFLFDSPFAKSNWNEWRAENRSFNSCYARLFSSVSFLCLYIYL